jgi:hypothetical protein
MFVQRFKDIAGYDLGFVFNAIRFHFYDHSLQDLKDYGSAKVYHGDRHFRI